MSDVKQDMVRWGHTLIHFDYTFSQRKTLAISVHPDLRVEVVAPISSSIEAIREKVKIRGPWIQKKKREFELLLPTSSPRSYVNGESHYYLGRRYRLKIENGKESSVKLLRGKLHVTLPGEPGPEKVQRLVERWYRDKATRFFRKRVDALLVTTHRVSFPVHKLQIRKMQSRWGSCSSSGLITLNLFLLRAPSECIDYVIAHELCHLKEPHHGPRFWHLLGRIMSNFEDRRERLQKFSQLIAH